MKSYGFYKQLSIYGILPVVGKSVGFFLIPIYTRVFSAKEFGEMELIVSLIGLLVYFINLEFYTAVGRYLGECSEPSSRQRFVSTGLWMTCLTALIVSSAAFFSKDLLLRYYLNGEPLGEYLNIAFLWLALNAISTYLSVIPRYCQKSRQYVVVNTLALLVRVLSTIVFVLYYKTGIVGVLYGHLCGSLCSIVSNSILSRHLLSPIFSAAAARSIISYAVPLVPGLLAGAFWMPTLYKYTDILFGIATVGLLSFAFRITGVLVMFRSVLQNAWFPMLYENIRDARFVSTIKSNALSLSAILLTVGGIVSLFSEEICLYVGTSAYGGSKVFIPFLCYAAYLQAMAQLKGFGPLIDNKTYFRSIAVALSYLSAAAAFPIVSHFAGLWTIGFVVVLYEATAFLFLYRYTSRVIAAMHRDTLTDPREKYFTLLFLIAAVCGMAGTPLVVRCGIAALLLCFTLAKVSRIVRRRKL